MKESNRVLFALVLAIALGVLVPASPRWLSAVDFIAPIGVLWVNAIRMTVIPLMVALLITGVSSNAPRLRAPPVAGKAGSSASASAVGRLGARTIGAFVILGSFMAVTMIPLLAAAFAMMPVAGSRPALPEGAAETARQLTAGAEAQTFAAWLTSLIPVNPIAALANGSMLQLVIFTLLFAAALSKSKDREPVLRFFAGVAEAMLILVRWIILLAPVGVFALVLPLASRAGAGLAGAIGFYIVVYSLGCVLAILLLTLLAAVLGRIPVSRYARASLTSLLVAFSSSSSIATLPAVVRSAEQLELPAPVTGFVLPLAASIFKAAAPVSWAAGALFVARLYGVPLGFTGLLAVAFVAVFFSFGVPGIPRGAFIVLTPVFIALGLPVEGLGILIAVDAIPDTFATALNVSGHLAAAAVVARS